MFLYENLLYFEPDEAPGAENGEKCPDSSGDDGLEVGDVCLAFR